MANAPIRLLGLTMERAASFRSHPSAKSAGLYAALDRRFSVTEVVRPAPSPLAHYFGKLRNYHPDRDLWRAQASLSVAMFRRRTAVAERLLREREGSYDLIVQLHTLFAPGRLERGRPYVLHTDNTYLLSERHYPPWAPLRGRARDTWVALERATYQGAAFLFPRSEFLRRSLIDDYGCDPARVIRVGGGANFTPTPLGGKRYGGRVALFVGSDFERKGGRALLEAWRLVAHMLPGAQLWIAGPKRPVGPPLPGVRWLGYVGDRARLAGLYAEATLFVLPALFEPWGHVFFEAMAHGLPCVGSDHGATPEIVRDGYTGLLVPAGEPNRLALALVTLLQNEELAAEMGRRAYDETLRGHTWDDVAGCMGPFIEEAAGLRARQVSLGGI